jgi:hypothetical protein
MTDLQTPTLEDRYTQRLAEWHHHTAKAQEAMTSLLALALGKPDPFDAPTLMQPAEIQKGDHVLHDDGWWIVAATEWATGIDGPIGAETVLTLTRGGHAPLEIYPPRSQLLTVVRS